MQSKVNTRSRRGNEAEEGRFWEFPPPHAGGDVEVGFGNAATRWTRGRKRRVNSRLIRTGRFCGNGKPRREGGKALDGFASRTHVQFLVGAMEVRVHGGHADLQGWQFPCRNSRARAAPALPIRAGKVRSPRVSRTRAAVERSVGRIEFRMLRDSDVLRSIRPLQTCHLGKLLRLSP
jgi:hypothetical protein